MGWLIDVLRLFFFFIDMIIYPLISTAYNLLMNIANTTIFTDDIIDLFASKVYALLGIFMLFKVSFSIMTYIVNPDEFADKSKGFSKLISNIVITLVLLITTPWIFSQAMDIQRIVLNDNILGKVFTSNETSKVEDLNAGNIMAFDTFTAFYNIDTEANGFEVCRGAEVVDFDGTASSAACKKYFGGEDSYQDFKTMLTDAHYIQNIGVLNDYNLINKKNPSDQYIMSYLPLISSLAGGFICWILIIFCFDIAVRSVKLGFLRMIAPIPIISRIDPKKGMDTFNKWVKSCTSTYLDLFVRLLAIYFAVFVISLVGDMQFVSASTGLPTKVDAFVKIFIIMGALLFAKQLPKLLEELTGMKMDGKFTMNPIKKLQEVPLLGTAGATVGGGAANLYNGLKNNKGFKGALKTTGSTLAGAGSGFFRGAHAELSGKNAFESMKKGTKGAVDARNLRTERELAGDGGISGVIRRTGVAINNMAGIQSGLSKLDKEIETLQNYSKFKSKVKDQADFDTTNLLDVAYDYNDKFDKDFLTKLTNPKNASGLVDAARKGTKGLKQYYDDLKNSGTATMDEITQARELWESAQQYVITKSDGIKVKQKDANGNEKIVTVTNESINAIKGQAARYAEANKSVLEGVAVTKPDATYDEINLGYIKAQQKITQIQAGTEYEQALVNKKNDSKK